MSLIGMHFQTINFSQHIFCLIYKLLKVQKYMSNIIWITGESQIFILFNKLLLGIGKQNRTRRYSHI